MMTKFIFDLDGAITCEKTLSHICGHLNMPQDMEELGTQTFFGNIPFIESFIKRVHVLGKYPVDEIASLLFRMEIYPKIYQFIQKHQANCIIVTEDLKCWVEQLAQKIGCQYYCSECELENNHVKKLTKILHKEEVVGMYKAQNEKVVFIGDEINAVEAMRVADISVAIGFKQMPSNSVLSIADYLVVNEDALCRLLNQLL